MSWGPAALRCKRFGSQRIWDSSALVVNCFETWMIWSSIDVRFKWFWLSTDLGFKWFGCHLIWDSSNLVVNGCAFQMFWLLIKWWACQLIWDTHDLNTSALVVTWSEIQMIGRSKAFLRGFLQTWNFEVQKRSFCARLPSNMTCGPDAWRQNSNSFSDFEVDASKVLRLPRISWAEAYELL